MTIVKIPHRRPTRRDVFVGLVVVIVAVVVMFFAGLLAVRAQEITAPTGVDMRPTGLALIEYLGSLAMTVVTFAAGLFARWIHVKTGVAQSRLEAEYNTRLGDIIHRGIEYAITTAKNEASKPDSPISNVRLDNHFLSLVASYVNRGAPQILKHFSIKQDTLVDMVVARLPAYFADVAVTGAASATPMAVSVGANMGVPTAPATSGQRSPDTSGAGDDNATNAG